VARYERSAWIDSNIEDAVKMPKDIDRIARLLNKLPSRNETDFKYRQKQDWSNPLKDNS
jgi:Ser-tRNA(Ala) deacylase AlaX